MVNESINTYPNPYTLPVGVYTPEQSFNNLIGCPLDGFWNITVIDNWPIDNGYVFS